MTTRTSLADRSRGLVRCQASNSRFRVLSPVATDIKTASKAPIAHAAHVRRLRGAPGLKTDFQPVIGAQDFQFAPLPGQRLVADALLVHPLDILIVISRFVVEQG